MLFIIAALRDLRFEQGINCSFKLSLFKREVVPLRMSRQIRGADFDDE